MNDLRRLLDDVEQNPEDPDSWRRLESVLLRDGYTETVKRLRQPVATVDILRKKIRGLRKHSQRRTFGKGAAYKKGTLFVLWRDLEPLVSSWPGMWRVHREINREWRG